MYYLEAPHVLPDNVPEPRIFLAGSITGARNWQQDIAEGLKDLDCTVINPRRKNFPMNDLEAGREQIQWEFNKIWNDTDIISFWFSNETLAPITLFELGTQLVRVKEDPELLQDIIIGCHLDYKRRFDVIEQTKLFIGQQYISTSVEDQIFRIREAVERWGE